MLLNIEKIPDEGLNITFDDVEPWVIQAAQVGLEGVVRRIDGELEVHRKGQLIEVTGALHAELSRACDRCSEDLPFRLGGPVNLSYVPFDDAAPEERELQEQDLDVGFYTGSTVDLAAVVSEHFALSLPTRLTCEAEGFALPACVRPASAKATQTQDPDPVDPRFAVLKHLKLDN
ncbi:DUF177 domain-containing protein [Myxococcota bacterium]|nr:DUF177 domain-containing protein [Myxococcota bacterium]